VAGDEAVLVLDLLERFKQGGLLIFQEPSWAGSSGVVFSAGIFLDGVDPASLPATPADDQAG